MANFYVDKDNGLALDNPANGSAGLPFLTLAYALAAAFAGDNIYVAPTATPYDVGATNLNVTKSINFRQWDGVRAGKPEINGGDATRLIHVNTANAVLFDNFVLEATNVGISSYIVQARAACRNVIFRNCDARGSVDLGAFNVESGASGVVVESTCTIDMDLGGAVYVGTTGAIECYASVILRGVAQAAFFISNGDSNGATFVMGGSITLIDVNNYVYRCGTTNQDGRHIIDSTFNLVSVPTTYTRTTLEIINPRYFQIEDGAQINTLGALGAGILGDVWVRTPLALAGNIYIGRLTVRRHAIGGYIVKVGDESPFSVSHIPNSFLNVEIFGVTSYDGKYYEIEGATPNSRRVIGNNKYYKIKDCTLYDGAYGIGIKGDDVADPSSYVSNNLIIGMRLSHMKTKGMRETRWFNNHVIETGKGGKGLDLTENTDDGAEGLGNGAVARNNLYEMDTAPAVYIDTASDLKDNDLDYSAFYCDEADIAVLSGVSIETLEDLRAARNIEHNSIAPSNSAPSLDANGLAAIGSEIYQAGVPINGLTEVFDSEGETQAILAAGVTLNKSTAFRRDKFLNNR